MVLRNDPEMMMAMSAPQQSVIIDLTEVRRRRCRQPAPSAAMPRSLPPRSLPAVWVPCMTMVPVLCWFVSQQGQDHDAPR